MEAFSQVQRAFHGVKDVANGDVLRLGGKAVTALRPAHGGHQSCTAKVAQQLLQVVLRHTNAFDGFERLGAVACVLCQVEHGIQPILTLSGQPHARLLSFPATGAAPG